MCAKLRSDKALTCRGDIPLFVDVISMWLLFRMVENQQRLESMRAAEARANSFLNPYSKGEHLDDDDDDYGDDEGDCDDHNDAKEAQIPPPIL